MLQGENTWKKLLMIGTAVAVLAACETVDSTAATDSAAPVIAAEALTEPVVEAPVRVVETTSRDDWGTFGLDIASMDTAVHPGDDFYQHVNGTWLNEFDIPADRTRYGSFTLLAEKSEQRVRFIIEDLAAGKT